MKRARFTEEQIIAVLKGKRRPNGIFRMTRGGAMFEACEGFDT